MSYIYPLLQNNTTRYKVYFLCQSKKIYLGLYTTLADAEATLLEAKRLIQESLDIAYANYKFIDYKKYISLCNFRDRKVYIKNPIYIYDNYFNYYLSSDIILTFDIKDLLFFSTTKISKRGNYIYAQDTITQQSILSRFGIPPHSVYGIGYKHKNGDRYDFRRHNLEIISSYKGVMHDE